MTLKMEAHINKHTKNTGIEEIPVFESYSSSDDVENMQEIAMQTASADKISGAFVCGK